VGRKEEAANREPGKEGHEGIKAQEPIDDSLQKVARLETGEKRLELARAG